MKEAKASGDQEDAMNWEASLEELITDFLNPLGIVTYVEEKMMKRFLSKNKHWVLFIFVVINLIIGFINFTYTKQDFITIIFRILDLQGISFLF